MNKIKYKDLSWPCKTAFIGGWVMIIDLIIAFVYGFVTAL